MTIDPPSPFAALRRAVDAWEAKRDRATDDAALRRADPDDFEERAAILEFDHGRSRTEAERPARRSCRAS